jgi:hypothetical protein
MVCERKDTIPNRTAREARDVKTWKALGVSAGILAIGIVGVVGISWAAMGWLMAWSPPIPVDAPTRLAEAQARMLKPDDPYDRWVHLADIAFWTVDTGDFPKAIALADEALAMAPRYAKDWNYGNVLHKVYLTRGRVALRLGQREAAATFLLQAGRTPGSPQLDSFGPNMLLCQEMLAAGEVQPVLRYIDQVQSFWEMDHGRVRAWRWMIEHGYTPSFGGNVFF